MDRNRLQRAVLETIGVPGSDHRLGRGTGYLVDEVKTKIGATSLPAAAFWEAVWSLIAQGLAFVNMAQPAPENWSLELSPTGSALLRDEEANPDDPAGFIKALSEAIPRLSPVAKRYVNESITAYNHGLYLASAVMLGVASEVVFLDTADSLVRGLGASATKLAVELGGKASYMKKVEAFERRLSTEVGRLPPGLTDGLHLVLFGVLDLLRGYRNDAGHAKSLEIDRSTCFINLRLAMKYFQRLYLLQEAFEGWNNTERA